MQRASGRFCSMPGYTRRVTCPCIRLSVNRLCIPLWSPILVLILLKYLVAIVLCTSKRIRHKITRPLFDNPPQCDDTFRDGAEVGEQWGGTIGFSDFVYGRGMSMELSHQLRWLWIGLFGFGRHQQICSFSFECFLDCFGLRLSVM